MKVNLSTKPQDIIKTMCEELQSEYYFFRKNFGGKQKYLKAEDQLLDKALEEEESQFTDINEHISKTGNRWITYTHVEYYSKAKFANAFHFAFIYYETYASCGAFFPMFPPYKRGKKNKEGNPDGVIIFTDHFFLRMAERTGKKYRSKELIREFICTKNTNALQADEDGEVIVKFKGGYGFGVQKSENPRVIEVRTYLTDKQLTPSQKRKCEKVDAYAEILADGMWNKDVALHTAIHSTDTDAQTMAKAMHNLKLAKKLGTDKFIMFAGLIHLTFMRLMTDILGMKLSDISTAQNIYIATETQECQVDFMHKYKDFDWHKSTEDKNNEFMRDLVDVMVKCGKKLKLKSMTREAIERRIKEVVEENKNNKPN